MEPSNVGLIDQSSATMAYWMVSSLDVVWLLVCPPVPKLIEEERLVNIGGS